MGASVAGPGVRGPLGSQVPTGGEAEGQGSESSGLPAGFPQHRVFSTLSKPVDLSFS